ncbi:MAG: transporter associated domain-containing protein [Pseudomonadota bacterium]
MARDTSSTGRWFRRIRTLTAPKDRAQLMEMLKEAQGQGLLDSDGLSMLEGVLQVSDLQVRDIMVPRNQMICLHRDDPAERLLPAVIESGHSRFPVMAEDSEEIVGILLAKDLLRLYGAVSRRAFDIREFLRAAVFVPESKRVNVLLKEFRLNRNHMAIVVDEYGGVAGLVTIEDVIEQIVGEIDDEYDVADETNIRREGDRQYSVRGATRIDEFNEFFDAAFPEDEFDTIAGLVSQQFGRLPRRGEAVSLEGFEFRVVRADRRRIESLRVVPPEPDAPDAEAAAASPDSG